MTSSTAAADRRSCSFPAFRAGGSTCARPSTRWRRPSACSRSRLRRAARTAFDELRGSTATSIRSRGARRRGIERAAICGVSFGGLVALRFAAPHPERASALDPGVDAGAGAGTCGRGTRSTCARRGCSGRCSSPSRRWRLRPEMLRRASRRGARGGASRCAGSRTLLVRAAVAVARWRARARLIATVDVARRLRARSSAPTLVVTGERALDRVVPVDGTSRVRCG